MRDADTITNATPTAVKAAVPAIPCGDDRGASGTARRLRGAGHPGLQRPQRKYLTAIRYEGGWDCGCDLFTASITSAAACEAGDRTRAELVVGVADEMPLIT